MIDRFFNIGYMDDENIFEDLRIGECPECDGHRNAYPVIRMDLNDLGTFGTA